MTTRSRPALQKHCEPEEDDAPMILEMKLAVLEELHLLDLTTTVESCKRLVTYLKQSELVNKLSKSVKQDVETRWNSVETMLSSVDVQEMWDEVFFF